MFLSLLFSLGKRKHMLRALTGVKLQANRQPAPCLDKVHAGIACPCQSLAEQSSLPGLPISLCESAFKARGQGQAGKTHAMISAWHYKYSSMSCMGARMGLVLLGG